MTGKTPEYTLKAISNYQSKFDRIAASLPKGTKDIITGKIGMSVNAYINELVCADLEKRGLIQSRNGENGPPGIKSECPF